ncbi:lipase family protein [Micromonospora sp. RHAY321]|uniref:lipase family protein n=1 Tax=Micromonospora sp. RHAY321 TaxID=2944807 RepID=UPI00207C7F23|nr:lipase family protein [Micromonospora sp. RHAY321]MCO1594892.1 lipase family protein [Micromonospora sp. RHAY321]
MDRTPACDAVELRVHGVSGVTAERILDHPVVVRVAGGSHAGFFRPRPGSGAAGGATDGVAVEAYRWGSLTAGAAVRTASMLLLLPFMLSNLAIWLRPPGRDRWGLLGVLCRLLAGTLTATFVLATVGVTLDLVGWQCVPYPGCRASRPYLAWLYALPSGPRLALLSLVPLLALRVVWAIGVRSARAFEGFGPPSEQSPTAGRTGGLSDAGFWNDERTIGWLRQIHVALGVGTLNLSLLAGISSGGVGAARHLVQTVAAVGLLVFCVVLLCLPVPASGARTRAFLRLLWAATVVVTVLCLGSAVLAGAAPSGPGKLPGYEGGAAGVVAAQGVLLVVLTAVTYARQRASPTDSRPFLRGLGTPIVAAGAVSVGAAFTATLVYRTADVLDHGNIPDPIRPNPSTLGPLEPPVAYWWAALAGLAALLIGAAATSATLLLSRRRRRRLAARIIERDYPEVPAEEVPRLRLVRETIARSQIVEELGPVLIAFLLIASLGLATVALDVIGMGPTQLAARLGGHGGAAAVLAAYVTDAGVWVISLLVICLMVLGFRSYRSFQTRRVLAVLWDLGTFWPRTVHPFAPPCYAARSVPELAKRITGLAARGPVVLSGHSHGSVLAAATVLHLPPSVLSRVSLLTYGSPLNRTYAQLYPAYLGPRTLCDLGERIGWRWRNLWRDTDPIGGPIFGRAPDAPFCADPATGDVDIRLRDPRSLAIDPADTVPPPVERHWPYHTQAAYQVAVRELIDRSR